MSNYKLAAAYLTARFGWTDRFAKEWWMERRNGLSDFDAFVTALASVYIDENDKPKVNPFRKGNMNVY